ncbi:MAG: hypothetical protein ACFFD3_05995 [Candidatus Thorarchaeota archaeon]
MGQFVTEDNRQVFEWFLRIMRISGIVNVTGWTEEAVRILLSVCRDRKFLLGLRVGSKCFTPILYPNGPMFNALVHAIVTGTI